MIPPSKIDKADLIAYLILDSNNIRTGNTKQIVNGDLVKDFYGLAICTYNNDKGYYLFYCNENWETITDAWHETMEEAVDQAVFEYTNTENGWIRIK
jgi:hypothetical protein